MLAEAVKWAVECGAVDDSLLEQISNRGSWDLSAWRFAQTCISENIRGTYLHRSHVYRRTALRGVTGVSCRIGTIVEVKIGCLGCCLAWGAPSSSRSAWVGHGVGLGVLIIVEVDHWLWKSEDNLELALIRCVWPLIAQSPLLIEHRAWWLRASVRGAVEFLVLIAKE